MPQKNWHNLSIIQVFEEIKSSKHGLDNKEVIKRLKHYGLNQLPKKQSLSRLTLVLNQLKSPLVYVLIFAVVISIFLKHYTDAGVIFFVVVVNTAFGYWQENKANNAAEKLKQIVKHKARVLRSGGVKLVDSAELVVGDVILLQAGDKVPADARLIEVQDLQTVEGALTGESAPIEKIFKIIDKGTQLAERENMVYMGTLISRGSGKAVVVATGTKTEIGKISLLIVEAKEDQTPLQQKLSQFSKWLTLAIVIISILIFIQGYFAGRDLVQMFLTVVALAVSAIPEGLLVAVTIILTLGMQFMLKRKALVRKLTAAETLGSTSIICTDKTGTLTEGKMEVVQTITDISEYLDPIDKKILEGDKALDLINMISVLCSSAEIESGPSELEHSKFIGEPTEIALLKSALENDYDKDKLNKEYSRLQTTPFSSESKYMATLNKRGDENYILVKGAPERLFTICNKILINNKEKQLSTIEIEKLKKRNKISLVAKF